MALAKGEMIKTTNNEVDLSQKSLEHGNVL
jgi:hypothetical protein